MHTGVKDECGGWNEDVLRDRGLAGPRGARGFRVLVWVVALLAGLRPLAGRAGRPVEEPVRLVVVEGSDESHSLGLVGDSRVPLAPDIPKDGIGDCPLPEIPTNPHPAHGSADVPVDIVLIWDPTGQQPLANVSIKELAGARALRTQIGSTPWTPDRLDAVELDLRANPKVIYGADDRLDVYEETDTSRLSWAASTCGLLSQWQVVDNGDGTHTIQTQAYEQSGRPACEGEPFAGQPTAAFCTGFLVGPDLVATAGHCFDTSDLGGTRFVFGFVMEDASTPVTTVSDSHVYVGVELVGWQLDDGGDYAVVRVDREVVAPGAVPFPLRRDGVVSVGTSVGVIGHPSGLPLKIAFGESTEVKSSTASGYFDANLDTYGGNSGSPVINPDTGVVEGILVRGEPDYVFLGDCFISNVLPDTHPSPETSTKTTVFAHLVPTEECVATYDVYLGTLSRMQLVAADLTEPMYDPGELADDTAYTWRVMARTSTGIEWGPAWEFHTSPGCAPHTIDQNGDWMIQLLPELTRLAQFYNSGGYHCEPGTEDGYAPGPPGSDPADTACGPHDADRNGDWRIQLSPELTRIVQFYNSGGYHCEPGTEDGYGPGP